MNGICYEFFAGPTFPQHKHGGISRCFKGDRIKLSRNGKEVVVMISAEDAELLELLEDKLDLDQARKRLADGRKPLSYKEAKRRLGL